MPSLNDILSDKQKYPDDQKITLSDGVETTLGDLRGGYLRQQDYTSKTQAVAREREAVQRERQEFESAKISAEQQLQELAARIVADRSGSGQRTTQDQLDELMERDPLAKRLRDEISGLKQSFNEAREVLKQQQDAIKQQQLAFIADQHRRALSYLKQQDPDINTDELVSYAQSNGIPRLDLAYRLMTEDRRMDSKVKSEVEKASKESYEKAKRELAAPPTLPNRRVAAAPPEDAPKSFEDAADRAARDPEILSILNGGA